jgi:hypothetical protein
MKMLHFSQTKPAPLLFFPSPPYAWSLSVSVTGTITAWFRFQILPPKFTMQNSYSPSHQNVGTYLE